MLEHGGNLREAAMRFGRPLDAWLDLSTGINPHAYPAPTLAADVWHRLPEHDPELLFAASQYYRAPSLLPVAGTQAAIQALPRLRPRSHVAVAAPVYAEHAYNWARAGHAVREMPYADLDAAVDDCNVLVVCNPNNPTGATVAPERLLDWADRLAARGGWLVVDEAFADMTPELSVASHTLHPGLIALRSMGKFFGLAGLRLGFVCARPALLQQLAEQLGPWTVSTAAQRIGHAALSDSVWQEAMRAHLQACGQRLQMLLAAHGMPAAGSALYQWWPEPRAERFHRHLASHAIWVRLFSGSAGGIRIGLPPDEGGWQRLQQALSEWEAAGAHP